MSAYVLFSNSKFNHSVCATAFIVAAQEALLIGTAIDSVAELRESLKGDRSLTFTEIAKLVGENWQSLPLPEREVYEGQARGSKERYYQEMAVYKETPEYRKYMRYLEEFNDKQTKPNQRVYPIESARFKSELTCSHLGNEDAKRARLEHHELIHGCGSVGSSIMGSSTALGGSTSTTSGSSSERRRESESRESPDLRHNSVNSILSALEPHHSSAAPMPSPASTHFEVDTSKRNKSRHLRQGSSSLRGITQMTPHQADMPQQQQQHLPSLSDMLASGQGKSSGPVTENAGFIHGFTPAHHRPSVSQGTHTLPPVSVPPLHHESSGSSVPTVSSSSFSRRLSDGPLPIHALLSDQNETPHRRDESPLYTTNYVASPIERERSAFGQFQGPKGYGIQSFQNDKFVYERS
jgi:hypothetical protein